MNFQSYILLILQFLFISLLSFSWAMNEDFLECLHLEIQDSTTLSKILYNSGDSAFSPVLQSSIHNFRLNASTFSKPQFIFTPLTESHIQAAVICAKKYNMHLRVRSGGHDYEGLSFVSYVSDLHFMMVDLINFQSVTVDEVNHTAWVQSGATLGKLYYSIAEKSQTLAFPGGSAPTVGVGGHVSNGGYGTMVRKFGLAADNVIDAILINVNGEILDRASMGEDLFWAIRGGGGNSFGIVISWKIKLVSVPSTVTVFTQSRTLEQNGTQLVHKWQYIADKLHEDLFLGINIMTVKSPSGQGNPTVSAAFGCLFLGGSDNLIQLLEQSFPELGVTKQDCTEMSWIESVLFMGGLPNSSMDALLSRTEPSSSIFKAKSDFVYEPIPETALEDIWARLLEEDIGIGSLNLSPCGGKLNEISDSDIALPHRAGSIYKLQHKASWNEEGTELTQKHTNWVRGLYDSVAPYVSKNPREAYIGYRDLDIGMNELANGNTSYEQASTWGIKYFMNNFDRLVHIKTAVDPSNFFRNEQSIPPLTSSG